MAEDYGSPEGKYGDAPPNVPDTFESLHQKKHNIVAIKTLINPVPGPKDVIGKSKFFTATPAVVHFGGLIVGKTHEHVVNIVNTSSNAQRMYVYNPSDPAFKSEYVKQGSLAPGMSQKITIKFRPTEYKYYHDFLRIQTDGETILIPLHAYPVLNKLDFPRSCSFGFVPLCEPRKKVITLTCSIPVDFSYELEVTEPHAYFHIEPVNGVIPANGSTDITITFNPVTLGQCNLQMNLHVGQYGFEPMPCMIIAQAVSGLLEDKELKQAQKRLMDYITTKGQEVNNQLGLNSSFAGSLQFQPHASLTTSHMPTTGAASLGASTKNSAHYSTQLLASSRAKHKNKDPTSVLLKSTFGTEDLNGAIDKVLRGNELMSTKVLTKNTKQYGVRGKDGVPINTIQPAPRGPGSGNVFDAGNHYMSNLGAKTQAYKTANGIKSEPKSLPQAPDKTVEGLRIPGNLDSFPAVNFVLTQEPGKLKPKDLKIAIEKSRAEREARAEEQELLRAQGGAAGQLDLRGILADERLNSAPGDPFKRQLRELAFLADVDDLAKQEQEKEFRVSEEFLGSTLLSTADIDLITFQRAQQAHFGKVSAWRTGQALQHTQTYPMNHSTFKAGAPATVAKRVIASLTPSFDPNKNDIWGKRMNTLRRFISLVSRHIFRERLVNRMKLIKERWNSAGATTRDEIRAFIEQENIDSKLAGPQAPAADKKSRDETGNMSGNGAEAAAQFPSVANMVCAAPNDIVDKRTISEAILGNPQNRYEFTANMIHRVLFPKFVSEEEGARVKIDEQAISVVPSFDDRTFFQLKVRPEYVSMGYTLQTTPKVPLCFPPARDKVERLGAEEEKVQRPAADAGLGYVEMQSLILKESLFPIPPHIQDNMTPLDTTMPEDSVEVFDELAIKLPSWATAESSWQCSEVDMFRAKANMSQVYVNAPRRTEVDDDWLLRPLSKTFEFDQDHSLRSQWIREGGFLAANIYLLGGVETRNVDAPPPPGPTLSNTYLVSNDRHVSGLTTFAADHMRSIDDGDADIAPLQLRQDKLDELTDSESDDEDAYASKIAVPSMAGARKIVRSAEFIAEAEAAEAAAREELENAMDGSVADGGAGGSSQKALDAEHPNVQVELLRDRKILELESTLKKARQDRMSALATRIEECSTVTTNRVSAMTFQLPFHMYEEELLASSLLDNHPDIPTPQVSLHEEHQYHSGQGMADTMGTLGDLSPMKGSH